MLNRKFISFIILGFLTFCIDLILPLGSGTWSLYIIIFVLYVSFNGSYNIIPLALLYITLSITGYFFSPSWITPQTALINRMASLAILILVAYLARREGIVKKFNRDILDRISDSVIAVDNKLNIIYMSSTLKDLSKIKDDPAGKNLFDLFPEMKNSKYEIMYREAMKFQKPASFTAESLYSDSKYEVRAYPSKEGLTIFARDISEILNKEKELEKLLEQKGMLIKEVHHRVKNNFQLISSFLRLSAKDITDEQTTRIFADLEARIKTLSLIHEKLYKTTNEEKIDLKSYLEELFRQLASASNDPGKNIEYEIVVEDLDINVDDAISIGLIVNELYSNSLKHGFKEKDTGKIDLSICFRKGDRSKLNLIYKDNGLGFNGSAESRIKKDSLGMAIVNSYVAQSDGVIEFCSNGFGVEFNILLPIRSS